MAGLTPLAQTARRRPKPAGDEEASSVLKLGEMSNSAALSTAAAHELLIKIEEARQKDPKLPLTHNDLIRKNTAYLEVFARHKGSDTVQQVTSEAETLTQLAEFERAQLGSLCCDTAEEARTLIPSLEGKITDEDLQPVLDNIAKLRVFT
ncbi:hypothetical protein Q7P36_004163 [Cladosporium allicinum]